MAGTIRETESMKIEEGRVQDERYPGRLPASRRWLWPLRSRKVQVAVATVVAAWASQAGLMLSEESVATVLGVGIALILGIAHEDAGRLRNGAGGS
jgi:hypothetical protein